MPKHTKLIAEFTEGSNKTIEASADFNVDVNQNTGVPDDLNINLVLEDGRKVTVAFSYLHFQSTLNVVGNDVKLEIGRLQAEAREKQLEAQKKQQGQV